MTRDFEILFEEPISLGKRVAVWRDKSSIMHRAVGAYVINGFEKVFLVWTACQKKDIPANAAWLQDVGDHVTCEECQRAEAIFAEEEAEEASANSQFGVGA